MTGEQASYIDAPFPNLLDEKLTNLARAFRRADDETRTQFHAMFDCEYSPLLLEYAERMASLAVHEQNPDRVLDGLLAVAMEGFEFDPRDSLIRLALLYHSATTLERNPQELFDWAASVATERVSKAMRGFTRERLPEDRTLKAMGYREARTRAQPLLYERTW